MYSARLVNQSSSSKTMKKARDEKVTVVVYRGMEDSRCLRMEAQHAMKSQQSFKLIINIEQSMRELAQDEAESRATAIATKYLDLREKRVSLLQQQCKKDNCCSHLDDEPARQTVLEARIPRFIANKKVKARDSNMAFRFSNSITRSIFDLSTS